MQFDRKNDPSPLPAALAVSRGLLLINGPVFTLMIAGFVAAYFLCESGSNVAGASIAVIGFAAAWLWWSWFVPQWRSWAHSRGANRTELQDLGVQAGITWPKGSFFERTEIRRRKR